MYNYSGVIFRWDQDTRDKQKWQNVRAHQSEICVMNWLSRSYATGGVIYLQLHTSPQYAQTMSLCEVSPYNWHVQH